MKTTMAETEVKRSEYGTFLSEWVEEHMDVETMEVSEVVFMAVRRNRRVYTIRIDGNVAMIQGDDGGWTEAEPGMM